MIGNDFFLKKRINDVLFFLLLFLLFYVAKNRLCFVIDNNAQLEFREGVGLKFAVDFSKGINPYSLNVLDKIDPPEISIYGFLSPLIVAPFIRLFSFVSALYVVQIFSLFVEFLSCFIFFAALLKVTQNKLASILGVFFFSCCFFRCGPVAGFFPDQFGIFFSVCLLYFLENDFLKNIYHPIIYDILIIMLFYTKSYFVFLGFGVLLFLLINSKKDGLKFLLFGIALGLLSIVIVQFCFPLYFSEAFAVAFCMVSGDNVSADFFAPWKYSLKQFCYLFILPFLFFSMLYICYFVYFFHKYININSDEGKMKKLKSSCLKFFGFYSYCQMFTMLVPTIYFAKNQGAYLSYPLQMWFPYFIFQGTIILEFFLSDFKCIIPKFKLNIIIHLFFILAIFNSFKSVLSLTNCCVKDASVRQSNWQKAYQILNNNMENILAIPVIGSYCVNNNIYGSNSHLGQATGTDYGLKLYNKSKILKLCCPYADELMYQGINFSNIENTKVDNGEYTCIVMMENAGNYTYEYLTSKGYVLFDRIKLQTGTQTWETLFYLRDYSVEN